MHYTILLVYFVAFVTLRLQITWGVSVEYIGDWSWWKCSGSGLDHEDDNDELTNDEEDVDNGADEEDDFHHAQ